MEAREFVDSVIARHSAEIAENVRQHNALLFKLTSREQRKPRRFWRLRSFAHEAQWRIGKAWRVLRYGETDD